MKDNFTDEEWAKIISTPELVGFAVTMAGYSGITGTMKESYSLATMFYKDKDTKIESKLVNSFLYDTDDLEKSKETREIRKAYVSKTMEGKASVLDDLSISEVEASLAILKDKCPEEIDAYKDFLITMANKVANAAKEGGFLGFGGTRVSEKEAEYIERLKTFMAEIA